MSVIKLRIEIERAMRDWFSQPRPPSARNLGISDTLRELHHRLSSPEKSIHFISLATSLSHSPGVLSEGGSAIHAKTRCQTAP